MKKGKRLLTAILLLAICLALCGCAKTYRAYSEHWSLYGTTLQGDPLDGNKVRLTLQSGAVRQDAKVSLEYYGREYEGVISEAFVLWKGDEPVLLDGATLAYTQIFMSGQDVRVLFCFLYMDAYLDCEMRFRK